MEFTGLGAEMARLAGRFGSVDPAAAGRADLEWSLRAGRRLRGMIDAHEASVTVHLEALIRQGRGLDEPDADQGPGASESGQLECDATGGDSRAETDKSGGGAGDASSDAAGRHRETAEEYRARLRRGKWLRRLPLFDAALQAGTITTAHLDALAAVLDHVEPTVVGEVIADEDALLEVARTGTRASFARYVRLRVDRIRDDGGTATLRRQIDESFGSLGHDDDVGLHRLFVRLDPIRGQQVYTAIRHRVDQLQQSGAADGMRRGQVIAQAITDLICGTATGATGGVEILVLVDLLSLLGGHHDRSICETGDGLPIPIDTVRDLCRQAGATITTAITAADGTTIAIGQHTRPDDAAAQPTPRPATGSDHTTSGSAATASPPANGNGCPTADIAAMVAAAIDAATGAKLHMGRDIRLANREQRRALRAMYRHCAHPGCRVPFADCYIHHITPWEHDGFTNLDNLLPLCGRHHHQVHEGRWRLTIDPARTLCWYQPSGTHDTTIPFQPLAPTTPVPAGGGQRPDDVDDHEAVPGHSIRWGAGVDDAHAATTNTWSRSRGARGSPPADGAGDKLRLFDPTAA